MSASPRKNVASKGVERIDHYIDSLDPGIRLHLREKRPEGKKKFEDQATLLIVHGRMAPGPVAYDLPVPGYSWMDYIASRGFDVFALSIRGFGESTWPQEMHVSPRGKPPAIPGKVAVKDIKAAVDFICEQRGVNKLSVLGRSWGTTTGPAYAADNMSQVQKLVLYAPYYAYDNPVRAKQMEDPRKPGEFDARRGAWSWCTEKDVHKRWWGHIPGDAHHKWREPKVIKAYFRELLRYDPEGDKRKTPAFRLANGSLADLYDRARNKPLYDASKITCPVLLIRGDQDGASADPEVWGLYKALCNSRGKRYVIINDGTHFMELEKRRMELLSEVQLFLEG